MSKKYYALTLLPPRPSFAMDMKPEERAIMQQHVVYWTGLMQEGKVVVFGPVLDPKAVYGLGVVAVDSEEELLTLMEKDPANGLNRYEWHPMKAVVPENK